MELSPGERKIGMGLRMFVRRVRSWRGRSFKVLYGMESGPGADFVLKVGRSFARTD